MISIIEYHMVTDWDGEYSSTDTEELQFQESRQLAQLEEAV